MSILLFLTAIYMALKSLITLVTRRRENLQGVLVEHVKNSRAESKKKRQILELRRKIRERKSMELAAQHQDEVAAEDDSSSNGSSSKAA